MKHDRFAGRKKPELPGQDPEWMETLKKYVQWAAFYDDVIADEERDMAKAVNNLFSLLGTERAKHEKRVKQLEGALEKIAKADCPNYIAHPQSVWWETHVLKIAREALGGGEGK